MEPTTRETLCTNGFVIQRKNGNPSSYSHVITTKNAPGSDGPDPGFPGRAGPLCCRTQLVERVQVALLHEVGKRPLAGIQAVENDDAMSTTAGSA